MYVCVIPVPCSTIMSMNMRQFLVLDKVEIDKIIHTYIQSIRSSKKRRPFQNSKIVKSLHLSIHTLEIHPSIDYLPKDMNKITNHIISSQSIIHVDNPDPVKPAQDIWATLRLNEIQLRTPS